jgi:hypothetical protein
MITRLTSLSSLALSATLSLGALLTLHSAEVSALSVAPMSIKALAERSTLVVRGEVVAQRVIQDVLIKGQPPRPFTLSEMKIEACWLKTKGYKEAPCPERVIVRQLGGTLPVQKEDEGNTPPLTLSVTGFSPLSPSWSGVLFLTPKWSSPQLREPTYAPSMFKGESQKESQGEPQEELNEASKSVLLPVMVIEGGPLGVRSEGLEALQEALQDALHNTSSPQATKPSNR